MFIGPHLLEKIVSTTSSITQGNIINRLVIHQKYVYLPVLQRRFYYELKNTLQEYHKMSEIFVEIIEDFCIDKLNITLEVGILVAVLHLFFLFFITKRNMI